MTAFNHAAFYAQLRKELGPLKQAQVDMYGRAIKAALGMQTSALPWVVAGMSKIGEHEIKGSEHNPFITEEMWADLGADWLVTDEDPWCGGFVAWCIDEAGLAYPKLFPRAGEWATWGVPCLPQVGAIGVKSREGGNHVFIIVGITADGLFYLALGGNQNDAVSIAPIPVGQVHATRWPAGVAQANLKLPTMAKTTTVAREA